MNLHLVQLAKNKIPDFSKSTSSKKNAQLSLRMEQSEMKQSLSLCDCFASLRCARNDRFWIIYLLEHSNKSGI